MTTVATEKFLHSLLTAACKSLCPTMKCMTLYIAAIPLHNYSVRTFRIPDQKFIFQSKPKVATDEERMQAALERLPTSLSLHTRIEAKKMAIE